MLFQFFGVHVCLFEYLESGDTLDGFLGGFPTVSRELALQVLEEARALLVPEV